MNLSLVSNNLTDVLIQKTFQTKESFLNR